MVFPIFFGPPPRVRWGREEEDEAKGTIPHMNRHPFLSAVEWRLLEAAAVTDAG
jgi:hypothetical protein